MTSLPRIQISVPPRSEDDHEFEMNSPRKPSPTLNLLEGLKNKNLDFPINTECTSLCLSPSGNFLWAGFSDGTLRVFDLSGRFSFESESWQASRRKSTTMVASKFHQRYGAVACQIHARGVHTDLLMQVDSCGDYVFGGVPRGAMELYAVSTKALEDNSPTTANILDSIHVHVHSDAKLKGFGACAQVKNASRPTYLLLTGKGIKNIHIWKFQPPLNEYDEQEIPVWEQLYDTQTNGNTINLLSFYRNPFGKLMGVSQSDTQKLRLWDLSWEEHSEETGKPRPKRPPHLDVVNSQGVLAIAGGYGVCGGPTMYNQLSIVSLDQPKSAYNHTELALPATSNSTGRQRRGDLKQVITVATLPNDSNHVLLELDDGSIVHYTTSDTKAGRPKLEILTHETTGIGALPADFWKRTLCLGKASGVVVAAISMYNPNTQLGHIEVRALQTIAPSSPLSTDNQALSNLCMLGPPDSEIKLKRKRKKKRPLEAGSEPALTKLCGTDPSKPLSTPVDESAIKRKKKKKLMTVKTVSKIPESAEKCKDGASMELDTGSPFGEVDLYRARLENENALYRSLISPNMDGTKIFESDEQRMTPPSNLNKSTSKDYNTCQDAGSSELRPPQVSPSASTPTHEGTPSPTNTPSSAESNKQYHGNIAKFLKPKRVLHGLVEKNGSMNPIAPTASPPVPRKNRKASEYCPTKLHQLDTNQTPRSSDPRLAGKDKSDVHEHANFEVPQPGGEQKGYDDYFSGSIDSSAGETVSRDAKEINHIQGSVKSTNSSNGNSVSDLWETSLPEEPGLGRQSLQQSLAGTRQSLLRDSEESNPTGVFCDAADYRNNEQVSKLTKKGNSTKSEPRGGLPDLNNQVDPADSYKKMNDVVVPSMSNECNERQSKKEGEKNPTIDSPLPYQLQTHGVVQCPKRIMKKTKLGKAKHGLTENSLQCKSDPSASAKKQVGPTPSNDDEARKLAFKVRKTLTVRSERRSSGSSCSSQSDYNHERLIAVTQKTTEASASGGKIDKLKSKQDHEVGHVIPKKGSSAPVERDSSVPTLQGEDRGPIHEPGRDANLVTLASLLVDLKSPSPPPDTKPSGHSESPVSNSTRDDFVIISAQKQWDKLQAQIDTLPKARSRLLVDKIDSFGSFPTQSRSDRTINEHSVTYSIIQKRLLQSAQATMRSLIQSTISTEGARAELKEAIRSFEGTLHNTLNRHKLELDALHDQTAVAASWIPFGSFQTTKNIVQAVYATIEPAKRPPGRPKVSTSSWNMFTL